MKLTAKEKDVVKLIVGHLSEYSEYEGVWPPHALRLSWQRPPVKERRFWPIFWVDPLLVLRIVLINDRGRPAYVIRSGEFGSREAALEAEFEHVPYESNGGPYTPVK